MIGIIGAGISGLSLAYHLEKQGKPYILLEASQQAGGYIKSKKVEDYLLELGPNSLLADQATQKFIEEELALKDQVLPANDVSKNRYIYRNGKYRKLPSSPPSLIFNNFFSWKTKWAIYREMKQPAQAIPQESLSGFFERRFNREIVDYALNPFVSGIYAGNPEELLLEQTFPLLAEHERNYGSVLKGFIKNRTGERKASFSFIEGMQTLPRQIAKQLSNLHYGQAVRQISKNEQGYTLQTNDKTYEVDKVVIASSALASTAFLADVAPDFAKALEQLHYPPMVVVHSVYPRQNVQHPLNGFGGLNPKIEGLFTAGSIWTSSIFKHRCNEQEVMFTSFVGGAQYEENTQQTAQVLQGKVHQELAENYDIKGTAKFQHIFKWEKAIPQYDKNILKVLEIATKLEKDAIFVCANWLGGVSISDCLRKAKTLADKLS